MLKMLIINPGSTSTKIAVYEDDQVLFEETMRHTSEELKPYNAISDQYGFRKALILRILSEKGIALSDLAIIMARGGLIKPVASGVFEVNDAMIRDLSIGASGQHASNLGGLIARSIADDLGIKAYIADPVVTDEMEPIAKVTGVPEYQRVSLFHALNQKAVSRHAAKELGKNYEDCNFIVVHLGGGISVGAHKAGKVVDVNNALLGDGPFSPERAGKMQLSQIIDLCFSGLDKNQVEKRLVGHAGMAAYLGTSSAIEVTRRIDEGDAYAAFIYEAMAYNVAKEIGAMAAVLKGEVDQIIITGGIAYDPKIIDMIKGRVRFIAEISIIPGEEEIKALAERGRALLEGELLAEVYR